jgi:hypothetical protein
LLQISFLANWHSSSKWETYNSIDFAVYLSMADMRLQSRNPFRQILIKEYPSSRNRVIADGRSVPANHPVAVDPKVDVDSSLKVESGGNGVYFRPAIRINRPHSCEESGVANVQVCMCYICDVQLFEEFFE